MILNFTKSILNFTISLFVESGGLIFAAYKL